MPQKIILRLIGTVQIIQGLLKAIKAKNANYKRVWGMRGGRREGKGGCGGCTWGNLRMPREGRDVGKGGKG